MATYTVHFIDRMGQLAHSKSMECQDDDAAIERTAAVTHRHALELWQGERLVWRFEPLSQSGEG
jgi:hypothetical protein